MRFIPGQALKTVIGGILFTSPAAAQSATTPAQSMAEQVAILQQVNEPVAVADLRVWTTLSPERNAALIADRAWKMMLEPEFRDRLPDLRKARLLDYQLPLTDEDRDDIRAYLTCWKSVLDSLNTISEPAGFDWGAAPKSPLLAKHEPAISDRALGDIRNILWLDGLLAIDQKDLRRAWDRTEKLRRFSDGAFAAPGVNSYGLNLQELAARLAGYAATAGIQFYKTSHRDVMMRTAAVLQSDEPIRAAVIRDLQEERIALIDTFAALESGAIKPQELDHSHFRTADLLDLRIGTPTWPLVCTYFTEVIQAYRAAPALSEKESGELLSRLLWDMPQRGPMQGQIGNILGPELAARHRSILKLRATQKLAAACIAVRLYRVDHGGAYPVKLDDLVPDYLNSIPVDPLSQRGDPMPVRVDHEDWAPTRE